jgi:hypothetical protein
MIRLEGKGGGVGITLNKGHSTMKLTLQSWRRDVIKTYTP